MATSNNRDVKLGVEIQTAGADSLGKAATEVRALAKAGGDAAPYLTELADGLDLAIAQAKEFGAFKTAAVEVQALTAASAEAAAVAERLQASYKDQAAVAETVRASQASIAASLDATKRATIGAVEQQAVLKASFKAGEVSAGAYAAQSSEAAAKLAGLKAAAAGLALDLKLAKTATSDAETALSKLATSSLKADESASRLQTTLRAQATAMESAAAAGATLGADFSNVAGAQAKLDQSLQGAVRALEQKAAADRAVIDLDNQHAAAAARLADRVQFLARAHAEETVAAEAAAAAERALAAATEASAVAAVRASEAEAKRVARIREQSEADRDAVRVAAGLAEQRAAGALALQAEIAAQRDAALSNKQYADGVARAATEQRAAAAEALRFVEALDAQAVAAEKTGRLLAEFHANDAQAQKRAAYEMEVAAALDAVDAAAAGAAQSMARLQALTGGTATSLQEAFGAVGVRSIAAIEAEISKTANGLGYLQQQFKVGALSAYDLQRATGAAEARMQGLRAEMARLPETVGVLERMSTATLDLATKFGALGVAAATIGFVAKPVLDANLALDSMQRVLTTVYGSAGEAAKQIEFLRTVAERSGLSVLSVGDAYTRFAASARASGIETALVQKVFEATANAAGNLGLSSDKTTHILDALGQMANKGTVSMEELRQQLGDSLPGAMSLLAKGLKITEAELVKLVTSGKLLTSEALGPLAEAMTALAAPSGRVEGLRAAMSRLGNQFTLAYQQISDTAFYRGITVVVDGLATNFNAVGSAAKLMFEVLAAGKVINLITNFIGLRAATADAALATRAAAAEVVLHTEAQVADSAAVRGNVAAKVAGAAASADLALATRASTASTVAHAEALALGTVAVRANATAGAAAAAASAGSLGILARASGALALAGRGVLALMGGLPGLAIAATLAVIEFGPAIGRLAAEFLGFGGNLKEVNKQLAEAERMAAANQKARDGEATSLVQVKVRYAEAATALASLTLASEKDAKATKERGDALILVTELSGEEGAKLRAVTTARDADAVALGKVAEAKRAEADATAKLVLAQEASIKGKGVLSVADAAELASLKEKVDLVGRLTASEQRRLTGLEAAREEAAKSILATQEQIKTDRQRLDVQRAAASEAEAAAVKERALADAADLAAAAFKNNAGRVAEYALEVEGAKLRMAALGDALRAGTITQEKYNTEAARAAAQTGLYRDALADAAAAGVDFKQVQTGVSDSFFKQTEGLHGVVTSLGNLKIAAEAASPVLAEAFNKQIAVAKTRQEIEFVTAEIERARKAGLLFGNDYEAAMLKAKLAIEQLSPVLRQANADAALLGVTLKDKVGGGADAGVAQGLAAYERLKASGKASAGEIGQAFETLANQAIKAANGQIPEWVKVEGAIRGATVQIDAMGNAVVSAAGKTTGATGEMAAGFRNARSEAEQLLDAIERQISAEEKQVDLIKRREALERQKKGVDINGFATNKAGETISQAGPTAEPPTGDGNWTFVNDARVPYRGGTVGGVSSAGMTGFWARTIQGKEADAAKARGESAKSQVELDARRAAGENPGASGFPVLGTFRAPTSPVATDPYAGSSSVGVPSTAKPLVGQVTPSAASTSHTVTINLPTGGGTINTASADDAVRLAQLLATLQTDMARSN